MPRCTATGEQTICVSLSRLGPFPTRHVMVRWLFAAAVFLPNRYPLAAFLSNRYTRIDREPLGKNLVGLHTVSCLERGSDAKNPQLYACLVVHETGLRTL